RADRLGAGRHVSESTRSRSSRRRVAGNLSKPGSGYAWAVRGLAQDPGVPACGARRSARTRRAASPFHQAQRRPASDARRRQIVSGRARRAVYFDSRFFGTFLPLRRASESPMAIACLRLFTVPPRPPLPLLSVLRLRRCSARLTSSDAPGEYLRAM